MSNFLSVVAPPDKAKDGISSARGVGVNEGNGAITEKEDIAGIYLTGSDGRTTEGVGKADREKTDC